MNKSLLLHLGLIGLSVGCQSPRMEPPVKRIEQVDDRVKVKPTLAYEAEGGHQLVQHGLYTA